MEKVVKIVAQIAGKSAQEVLPKTSLSSLGVTSSIQILKLQSALERQYQQKLPLLSDNSTIEQIAVQVGEATKATANSELVQGARESIQPAANGSVTAAKSPAGLFIGVDIEEIDNLPDTNNYRNHEFYQSLFTQAEISYALLKQEPKRHLCGMFCAKEALKKSAPELINLRLSEISVSHQQGRPLITTVHPAINSQYSFQVSISHAQHYAVATVLAIAS